MTVAVATLVVSHTRVRARGFDASNVASPPHKQPVCSDTLYCAPQKRSGETCILDEECLSEMCHGHFCASA
jgi:hypothetical protein